MVICCSGKASGTISSTRLRNARVVFAFSAAQCVRRAATCSTCSGSVSVSGAGAPGAAIPKSSVFGTR
jgi:hypothetical protein